MQGLGLVKGLGWVKGVGLVRGLGWMKGLGWAKGRKICKPQRHRHAICEKELHVVII